MGWARSRSVRIFLGGFRGLEKCRGFESLESRKFRECRVSLFCTPCCLYELFALLCTPVGPLEQGGIATAERAVCVKEAGNIPITCDVGDKCNKKGSLKGGEADTDVCINRSHALDGKGVVEGGSDKTICVATDRAYACAVGDTCIMDASGQANACLRNYINLS